MDGLDKVDRDQIRSAAEYIKERVRHNAGPFAVPQMGANAKEGVTDDLGLDRHADRRCDIVDDAAVLHVLAEKAKPVTCSFPPGDGFAHGVDMVPAGNEDIALPIERQATHILERLVFEIGHATIDFEGPQCSLDRARGHGVDFDRGGGVVEGKARRQKRDGRHRRRNDTETQNAGQPAL